MQTFQGPFYMFSSAPRALLPGKKAFSNCKPFQSAQVVSGVFDWLTLWWLVSLIAWSAALLVFHLVRSGRMEVPWLCMMPSDGAGDIETGVPIVRIVDGVLERR